MSSIIKYYLTLFIAIFALNGYSQVYYSMKFKQPPVLIADAGEDKIINEFESITIGGSPSAFGGTQDYIYNWTPSEGLNNPDISNPLALPAENITYILTVYDAENCSATDAINITVIPYTSSENNITQNENILIYPAHSTEGFALLINNSVKGNFTVSIYNLIGMQLYYQQFNNSSNENVYVKLTDLPDGILIVKLEGYNFILTKKFIKTN